MHVAPGFLEHRSMIDYVNVSSDLWTHVLDTQVKRGVELPTDHRLVVSSIRCQVKMLNISGVLKCKVRLHWEHLILGETGDMESEWTMFRTSIAEVAPLNCSGKGVSACGWCNVMVLTPEPDSGQRGERKHQAEEEVPSGLVSLWDF